jgi:hypothetical protein
LIIPVSTRRPRKKLTTTLRKMAMKRPILLSTSQLSTPPNLVLQPLEAVVEGGDEDVGVGADEVVDVEEDAGEASAERGHSKNRALSHQDAVIFIYPRARRFK